jgi:hypothetical protein
MQDNTIDASRPATAEDAALLQKLNHIGSKNNI